MLDKLLNKSLILTIAALIFPVWSYYYYSTADSPSHSENAANLYRLIFNYCQPALELFHITKAPVPNYLTQLIYGALQLIMPAEFADKLLITLYIILFPLSVWQLIKLINPANKFLLFPVIIFVFNLMFYMGSYNFLFSIIVYFFTLSWWLKNRSLGFANWLILFTLFNILYFFHILGFAFFCITIATIICAEFVAARNFKHSFKQAIFTLTAAALNLCLLAWYMALPKTPVEGYTPLLEKLYSVFFTTNLYSNSESDLLVTILTSCFIWITSIITALERIRSKRKLGFNDFPLLIASVFFLFIIITPVTFGGGWVVEPRFQLVAFIMLIVWFANQPYSALAKKLTIYASLMVITISLFLNMERAEKYNSLAKMQAEILQKIPDNSTFMSVDLNPQVIDYRTGEKTIRAMPPSVVGYFTANKCLAEVSNFHSSERNVFPVSYKDSTTPYDALGKFRTINALPYIPPEVDFKDYMQKTGIKIDYVVVFGTKERIYQYKENELDNDQLYNSFSKQLADNFELIYSRDDGLAKLYKLKPYAQ